MGSTSEKARKDAAVAFLNVINKYSLDDGA